MSASGVAYVTQAVLPVNVKTFGAAGDGVTDDAIAIQKAINFAQIIAGTVLFPPGTYLHNTELSVTAPIRLTGTGGATILSTSCAGINFQNTYITAASSNSTTTGLEIDHLIFDVTGGHVFYNTNWNKFNLHDLRLVQRSFNFAAWFSTNAGANQLTGSISNVLTRVYGAVRTVEAWHVLSSIGGGMAFITAKDCLFQNNDHDTTQFFVHFECTGTHNYVNAVKFLNVVFDAANGGAVRLLSAQGIVFDQCSIVDTFSAVAGNSMYYIGASTGGSQWASQKVSFLNCNRDLQGPNGAATWDIYLEATTDSVIVDTYEVRDIPGSSVFFPYFNFNGATDVTVINCNGAVITNPATTGLTFGPNGNINYTGALSGATQPNVVLPGDQGYVSWTFDPSAIQAASTATPGDLFVGAFYLRVAALITDVVLWVNVAGGTLVAAENFAGLWDPTGTLLTGSADQTANWGAVGTKTAILTTPQALTAGWYWAGALANGATGPQFGRASSLASGNTLAANAGTSAGSSRYGRISAFGTALGNFNPANLNASGPPIALWLALK